MDCGWKVINGQTMRLYSLGWKCTEWIWCSVCQKVNGCNNKDRFELRNMVSVCCVAVPHCCLNESVAQTLWKGYIIDPASITTEMKVYVFITYTHISICSTFLQHPVHCFLWYAAKRSTINGQINRPILLCATL